MNFADKIREQTANALRAKELEEERERLKRKAEYDKGFVEGKASAKEGLNTLRKEIEETAKKGGTYFDIHIGERDSERPSNYNDGFMNGKHETLTELLTQDGFDVKSTNSSGAYKYDSDCNAEAWFCRVGLSVSWGVKA